MKIGMIEKFAFPDVKEGSVIEVSYKIRSPYLLNFRQLVLSEKNPGNL